MAHVGNPTDSGVVHLLASSYDAKHGSQKLSRSRPTSPIPRKDRFPGSHGAIVVPEKLGCLLSMRRKVHENDGDSNVLLCTA